MLGLLRRAAAAAEMPEVPPRMLAELLAVGPKLGRIGTYVTAIFGDFDFTNIELTPPTETFDGAPTVHVGARPVELIEVGPAHTRGDVIVRIPDARVLFTGDILFYKVHPIIWAGPTANWIAACDRILAMDVDVIVPGHGP